MQMMCIIMIIKQVGCPTVSHHHQQIGPRPPQLTPSGRGPYFGNALCSTYLFSDEEVLRLLVYYLFFHYGCCHLLAGVPSAHPQTQRVVNQNQDGCCRAGCCCVVGCFPKLIFNGNLSLRLNIYWASYFWSHYCQAKLLNGGFFFFRWPSDNDSSVPSP